MVSAVPVLLAPTVVNPRAMPTPSSKLKPSKSILKTSTSTPATSTIGQKRKRVEMDMSSGSISDLGISSDDLDDEEQGGTSPVTIPSSPAKKRARVTFEMDMPNTNHRQQRRDEEAEQHGIGSNNPGPGPGPGAGAAAAEKSIAMVREEVRRAIQRHLMGDSEAYDRVKEIFTADPKELEDDGSPVYDLPSPTSLRNHLLGLFSNVSALDGSCSGLVHAVLGSEWLGRDEGYVKLFVRFLGTLAAARGTYLNSVLRVLVHGLRQVGPRVGKLPGYPVVYPSEIYARVHMAIRYIIQLIPAGSGALSPLIASSFPYDTDTAKAHIVYTRNIIKIIDYAPELRSDILALVTEKLVKIDVQFQVDLEDADEDIDDDNPVAMSSPEAIALGDEYDDEDSDTETIASEDDDLSDIEAQRAKQRVDTKQKIDFMIDILFEYYSVPFNYGTVDEKETANDLLLSHFQTIILPTYRSRHTQFLLFHYSQSSPIFIDRFATTCVQIIFSKSQPTIIRQYAAAYLASFVARGAHVSSEVVRDVFDLLGTHLKNLQNEYEPTCRGPDLKRYGPFYSTAQALLYIFCFRWRDLTTAALEADITITPASSDWLDNLDLDDARFPPQIKDVLHPAINSKLNPLKICSPAIVSEFARLTHHLGFMYLYSLIETNKRVRISSFRSLTALAMESRFGHVERETKADDDMGPQLDAYFPFDPYHLPRSRRWVVGDYLEWRGIPGVDDRKDEDEFDDDETSDASFTGDEGADSEEQGETGTGTDED
ncbi:ribosomal DNA transcription factor Rrn3 [Blastomyces gilchristii SLH14081]|uniref:Ribosomal DNA transcription factor Rrn3 n=1 Tax=Blastomyces gilchristii (strain SLH14081) TaxID=559298 RepID=A0A179ULT2_BLAGS|nr:RNA polymerase I-specific transcription initiation factor RRN3 family protein [Blastomyces gilchristii SLH14081]OAT08924.1 ribosomal DNA transcription factor Rrn3 [Blastomyces gilchristii SLH14081]